MQRSRQRVQNIVFLFIFGLVATNGCKTLENKSNTNREEEKSATEQPAPVLSKTPSTCGIQGEFTTIPDSLKNTLAKNWRLVDDLTTKRSWNNNGKKDYIIHGFRVEENTYSARNFFYKMLTSRNPFSVEIHEAGSFQFNELVSQKIEGEEGTNPTFILIFKGITSYYDKFACIVTSIKETTLKDEERLEMIGWLARTQAFSDKVQDENKVMPAEQFLTANFKRIYEIEEKVK